VGQLSIGADTLLPKGKRRTARTRLGQPISTEDAQIAAISLATGLTVATRNTKDFGNIDGQALANPWQATTAH
jgi:hypothetical protein